MRFSLKTGSDNSTPLEPYPWSGTASTLQQSDDKTSLNHYSEQKPYLNKSGTFQRREKQRHVVAD